MMVSVEMFLPKCDVPTCPMQGEPQYSSEPPMRWEVEYVNGHDMLLCPAHRFGLSQREIDGLKVIANALTVMGVEPNGPK